MNLAREVVTLAVLCIALFAPSAPAFADLGAVEKSHSISKHVAELFAKADELAAQRKRRSEEYLLSLPDKELAGLYAKATAPQQLPPSGLSGLSEHALKDVKEDRRKIVQQLLRHSSPLGEREDRVFGERREEIVDELRSIFQGGQDITRQQASMTAQGRQIIPANQAAQMQQRAYRQSGEGRGQTVLITLNRAQAAAARTSTPAADASNRAAQQAADRLGK
jgi:hypothetical protein